MPTNTPFGFRTGFQSRASRFGMGLGVLNVSRGYGPLSTEPIVPPEPVRAKEGGPSARAVKTKRRKPKVVSIRKKPTKKKRTKNKAGKGKKSMAKKKKAA